MIQVIKKLKQKYLSIAFMKKTMKLETNSDAFFDYIMK